MLPRSPGEGPRGAEAVRRTVPKGACARSRRSRETRPETWVGRSRAGWRCRRLHVFDDARVIHHVEAASEPARLAGAIAKRGEATVSKTLRAAVPSTRSQSHISQALMVKDWSAVAQISDPKHWSSPLAETATFVKHDVRHRPRPERELEPE